MFDPASIGLAISVGSKAFGLLKQGIAAGREIQDMASQLSEWGKAVSDIAYRVSSWRQASLRALVYTSGAAIWGGGNVT